MANRLLREFYQVPTTMEARELMNLVRGKYAELAEYLDYVLPDAASLTVALRQLLESKDTAVRAIVYKEQPTRAERF